MKKKHFIAAALLIAMLAGTFSCAETADEPDVTSDSETQPEETLSAEDARKAIPDDLPESDFDGRSFTILTYDQLIKDTFVEEATGDVIDDAVYERNRRVEERFNCKLEVLSTAKFVEANQLAQRTILANEEAFQLAALHAVTGSNLVAQDLFMNWYDIDYINFDKPWWSDSTKNDLTYGSDKAALAIGDFALSSLSGTYCYFFDKAEAEDYSIENLYEVVNDGKWTLDYVMNTTKDIYRDINGNGERDAYDFYGMTQQVRSALNTYLWSSGNKVVTKNNNGEFEITYKNERTTKIIEKLYKLVYESEGVCVDRKAKYPENAAGLYADTGAMSFRDGLCLFAPGTLDMTVNFFRTKQNEYGIIPYPKLDEEQKDYYTMVDGYHTALAVPKTVSDTEFVGIITEALNAESYKIVYPAYYETALKAKYTYDDESVVMLDKIVNSRIFDFGYIYDNFKGMSFYIQYILDDSSNNLESYYAKYSSASIAHYEEIFKYYEEME